MAELEVGVVYAIDPKSILVESYVLTYASFPEHPEDDDKAPRGATLELTGHLLGSGEPATVNVLLSMPTIVFLVQESAAMIALDIAHMREVNDAKGG